MFSDVALIVAFPAPTAVTNPDVDTVATLPLLVPQVTVRSASAFPLPSDGVAVKAIDSPSASWAEV
jgi:hypothetical protein